MPGSELESLPDSSTDSQQPCVGSIDDPSLQIRKSRLGEVKYLTKMMGICLVAELLYSVWARRRVADCRFTQASRASCPGLGLTEMPDPQQAFSAQWC